jgi:transposase, IS6 family
LCSRDVEALRPERSVVVEHHTLIRWGQRDAPALEQRCRPLLNVTTDSSRVDETSIKIRKQGDSLARAVESEGNTIACMLSATRDAEAAAQVFRHAFPANHPVPPWVITVDTDAAYPIAIEVLQ